MEKVRQREIKFRAWVTESERMVYDPYHFEFYHYSDENRVNQKTYRIYETWRDLEDGTALNCELMQSTGLKDKNGKEIYEVDIVRWHSTFRGASQKEHVDKIEWQDAHACFLLMPYVHEPHAAEMEVIGNIFEHPHLLSQGEIKTELI